MVIEYISLTIGVIAWLSMIGWMMNFSYGLTRFLIRFNGVIISFGMFLNGLYLYAVSAILFHWVMVYFMDRKMAEFDKFDDDIVNKVFHEHNVKR